MSGVGQRPDLEDLVSLSRAVADDVEQAAGRGEAPSEALVVAARAVAYLCSVGARRRGPARTAALLAVALEDLVHELTVLVVAAQRTRAVVPGEALSVLVEASEVAERLVDSLRSGPRDAGAGLGQRVGGLWRVVRRRIQ